MILSQRRLRKTKMDGVFNTGLSFSQIMIGLVTLIFGAIAIKITFNFDVNRFLENREKRYSKKLKNACMHFEFAKNRSGAVEAKSFFVSPPGTVAWLCERCGLIRQHIDQEKQGQIKRVGEREVWTIKVANHGERM